MILKLKLTDLKLDKRSKSWTFLKSSLSQLSNYVENSLLSQLSTEILSVKVPTSNTYSGIAMVDKTIDKIRIEILTSIFLQYFLATDYFL